MLLEYALILFQQEIVPLKGVWFDPNKEMHEGRVIGLHRNDDSSFTIILDGLWGSQPVTITQDLEQEQASLWLQGLPSEVQYGSLVLKVDHFRTDPLEWLTKNNIDMQKVHKLAFSRRESSHVQGILQ